jgi:hypothetical protein
MRWWPTDDMPISVLYPWWCATCQTWRHIHEERDGRCPECGGVLALSQEYLDDWVRPGLREGEQ